MKPIIGPPLCQPTLHGELATDHQRVCQPAYLRLINFKMIHSFNPIICVPLNQAHEAMICRPLTTLYCPYTVNDLFTLAPIFRNLTWSKPN